MKIATILPSRGLIFSRTAEEILLNLRGFPHKIFFAHRLGIPECFEAPTERALADKDVTHLWFVEDDMILPPDILTKMHAMDVAVVTADYPTNENGRGAVFKVKNQVIFCGTGCTLVKREVFNELRKPYFTTDIAWNVKNYGDYIRFIPAERGEDPDGYGLHDVNFCMNLFKLRIPIHDVGVKLGQRKLLALGKAGSNDGAHQIAEWTKIKRDELLKRIKKWPVQPTGNLVSVLVGDREILTSRKHASKLVRLGMATRPPRKYVVVDDGRVV